MTNGDQSPSDKLARDLFEERAFGQRFLRSIKRNPNPPKGTGALDYISQDCPDKAEFIKRDEKGHYIDPTLDAMWWAWQESREQLPLISPSAASSNVRKDAEEYGNAINEAAWKMLECAGPGIPFNRVKEIARATVLCYLDALAKNAPASHAVPPAPDPLNGKDQWFWHRIKWLRMMAEKDGAGQDTIMEIDAIGTFALRGMQVAAQDALRDKIDTVLEARSARSAIRTNEEGKP